MEKPLHKSPFILVENFLTKNECEDLILSLQHSIPNRDEKNYAIKTIKYNQLAEIRIMPKLDDFLDQTEPYYGFTTKDISPFNFEWYAETYKGGMLKADNALYINNKWVKSRDIDFTILIFLSDSKTTSITDTMFECFGGKLEFFNHKLTITPKAGTILMYPANDHFLNTFTEVGLGNLNCIRVEITASIPYVYNPKDFPGDYRTWF